MNSRVTIMKENNSRIIEQGVIHEYVVLPKKIMNPSSFIVLPTRAHTHTPTYSLIASFPCITYPDGKTIIYCFTYFYVCRCRHYAVVAVVVVDHCLAVLLLLLLSLLLLVEV